MGERNALFTTPDLAAVFVPVAHVRQMRQVEAALARHALDPAAYLGSTDMLIERALAAYHALQQQKHRHELFTCRRWRTPRLPGRWQRRCARIGVQQFVGHRSAHVG